ncbi:MAG: PEGA domain-containing protein [Patescibacteria group bacterium]
MALKHRRFIAFLAGTLAVAAFLVISSAAVVWANGLRYNNSTGSFEKTVLIAIDSNRAELTVTLNGVKVADQIPYRARNLLQNTYVVELSKVGFQTWKQIFLLSEGQIGLIKDPVLIAQIPLVTNAEAGLTPILTGQLDFGLNLADGELSDGGTLVTRFGRSPLQVHRFNEYYLYQDGNQLRLFIPAGTQDYLIHQSGQIGQLPIELFEDTWQVAIQDGTSVKLINLTIPTAT